ncbi:hypothetical protein ACHAXS_005409 [Conticribra weissflogii]
MTISQDNTHRGHSASAHRPQQYFVKIMFVSIASTLMLAMVSYFFLESKGSSPRMNTLDQVAGHYLRNIESDRDQRNLLNYLMSSHSLINGLDEQLISATNGKISDIPMENLIPSLVWEDGFFSPLLESPLLHELQRYDKQTWMNPKYEMKEDEDQVSLTVAIPEIPLEDINIEVIGERIVHIYGEKKTETSQVSFDKRFSIGNKLDESNLKAELTKGGTLVVTAPKAKMYDKKEDTRKIPIVLAKEL